MSDISAGCLSAALSDPSTNVPHPETLIPSFCMPIHGTTCTSKVVTLFSSESIQILNVITQ